MVTCCDSVRTRRTSSRDNDSPAGGIAAARPADAGIGRWSRGAARSLCVAGVSLALGALACRPGTTAVPLSGTLRSHLEAERLDTVTSIGGLPAGVQDALRRLFGSASLDIAEPGAAFQRAGEASGAGRPSRRLVAAGCSTDHCLVYYERGGAVPAWRVALFRWAPDASRFEWGGAAPAGLAAIGDVRDAVLTGQVESPERSW